MNCHRARQLISPYLDQQLTGQQMLELQQHLAHCASCNAERLSIAEVKRLLRGLYATRPRPELSQRIVEQMMQQEQNGLPSLSLPPVPQRGRRLALSLALSCLTVLTVAAPFAPGALQQARRSAPATPTPDPLMMSADTSGLLTLTPPPPGRSGFVTLTGAEMPTREQFFARYGSPQAPKLPFSEDSARRYAPAQVSFIEYPGYRGR